MDVTRKKARIQENLLSSRLVSQCVTAALALGFGFSMIILYHCIYTLRFNSIWFVALGTAAEIVSISHPLTRSWSWLTLASFFAAGLRVSPTETLRPVRWLLPFFRLFIFLSASRFSPNHASSLPLVCFFFLIISSLFFSRLFPPSHFSLSLSLAFIYFLSLAGDRSHCQRRATKTVVSKSCVFPAAQRLLSRCACAFVCVCVWEGEIAGHRTAESSAFLSQLVTQKTMSEVQSIAGQVPAAGGREGNHGLIRVCSRGQGNKAHCQMYFIMWDLLPITEILCWMPLGVEFKGQASDLSKIFIFWSSWWWPLWNSWNVKPS